MKGFKWSLTAAVLLGCAAANPAGAALIFSDNFDTAHDLLTQGVEGTGWHGMITHGNVSAFNVNQQAAGKLHIQSSRSPAGDWTAGGSSIHAPFLWVGVTGDFIAETHISGALVADWHASGILARMPDDGGNLFTSQGSFSSIPRHMTWNTTNGSRQQFQTSTTAANLNYYQLERSGDTFTARYSNDGGANWVEIASRERSDLASAPYLEVGVFQTPVSSSSRWAQFDYFQLTGSGGLLPQPSTRILDGTSGANVYEGEPLSTGTDGLTLNLGFFADVLVVGGGGGGGIDRGGGGGAGGLVYEEGYHISEEDPLSVSVGAGGAGSTSNYDRGANGSPSSLGTISATGGGGGGSFRDGVRNGAAGGSGGGGVGRGASPAGSPGAGTEGQGHAGGSGTTSAPQYAAGGGGGAGSAGGAGTSSAGGDGGDGAYYGDLFGEDYGVDGWFAGGGGGASQTANPGAGQAGGGDASSTGNGANAIANTGSGGGGGRGSGHRGGAGGDGIVLLRYAGNPVPDAGGAVYDPGVPGYTAHAFTDTGPSAFDVSGVDMNARLATTVPGAITGTGWLTFAGPGTLTLAGENTYTGITTVGAGTLLVNGSTHAESEVVVNAGATLGGTGTIGGAATIENGAVLSPGASLGELTFLSDLAHEPGAAFQWEFDSSLTNADLVNVAGDLTLTGAALDLADLAGTSVPLDLGTKFTMLSYGGDLVGTFDGYDNLQEFEFGANLWRINYADSAGGVNFSGGAYANFVTLTAVPEPAAWLLLLSALACGLLARRRRGT